ncbi:MAG: OmpA/MotB family protein [Christensenellales bacterium]
MDANDPYEYDDDDDLDFDLDGENDLEDGEGEGWLTSYSDMITDLLAIFVILFSFAMLSQGKFKDTGGVDIPVSESIVLMQEEASMDARQKLEERSDHLVEAMNDYFEKSGLSEDVSVVSQESNMVMLRMADSVLFESGDSSITPDAEKILDDISGVLQEHMGIIKIVRIEGHTDNRPIRTARFESNWELSADRAVKVLRELLERFPQKAHKFAASGYGEYHPVEDNDTPQGRAKNRRVDFFIELEDVPVDQEQTADVRAYIVYEEP